MKFAMRCGALVTASLLVSACGESGESAAPVENTAAVADMIAAGEYEVKTKVTSLDVTAFLLEAARVAVVPGRDFGSDAHVRLSYATSDALISEGLKRMGAALATLA